ncbi:hypothetical protein QBC47DRAFT_408647 [Echria macrotheca]|uniref:Uncharacterized protein n=1 Tax=Echria macrotheca TaxID=438768 RepID=A0AAJ0FEQ3_9PEZI|nr:hypothetical protein QBC47DRAFT_408647 [Echria macrotheca]
MDSVQTRAMRRRAEKHIAHDESNPCSSGTTFSDAGPPSPNSAAPKSKPTVSFRDRLFQATKPAPASPKNSGGGVKKSRAKVSIAEVFKPKAPARFRDVAKSMLSSHSPRQQRKEFPDADPEDLIKRLKKHYLDTATNLHERATIHLQQAQSDLTRHLNHTLPDETSFLAHIETQNKTLCAPLSEFVIRSEQRDPNDGSVRVANNTVAELDGTVRTRLQSLEMELDGLWKEWDAAEAEVQRAERAYNTSSGGEMGGSAEGGRFEEVMESYRGLIEAEIEEAEEEVDGLAEAVVGEMREIEKEFRKATLPDLHVFFQSIDEP